MITCPQCQIEFRGHGCPKCAWAPKSQKPRAQQICERLNEEAEATAKAQQWLITQGIKVEEMTQREKTQTIREMVSNLASMMRGFAK